MDGEIKAIIRDIDECKDDLGKYHEGLKKHLKRIQKHLEKLFKNGLDAYLAKGFRRHQTDPGLNDDRVFLIQFINGIENFYDDLRRDNAHQKMEAFSKASIKARNCWRALFAGDYPGVHEVQKEGVEIFDGLILLYHREEDLQKEEY